MRRPEDQTGERMPRQATATINKVDNGDILQRNNTSQSGPQTPVSANFKRRGEFYRQQLKDDQHNRKCVFNALINQPTSGYESDSSYIIKKKDPHSANFSTDDDERLSNMRQQRTSPISHKDYVAVQQGQDIPFEGLRRPAPQPPHAYQGEYKTESLSLCNRVAFHTLISFLVK